MKEVSCKASTGKQTVRGRGMRAIWHLHPEWGSLLCLPWRFSSWTLPVTHHQHLFLWGYSGRRRPCSSWWEQCWQLEKWLHQQWVPSLGRGCGELLQDIKISSWVPSTAPAWCCAQSAPGPHSHISTPLSTALQRWGWAALRRGAAALAGTAPCSSSANPNSTEAAEPSRLGAFPSSFRCWLAWSLPVPAPSCTWPLQSYGLEKQEWRGVHGIICLLFNSTGAFPAHAKPRWHPWRVWLGLGSAVPTGMWMVAMHIICFSVCSQPVWRWERNWGLFWFLGAPHVSQQQFGNRNPFLSATNKTGFY